MGRGSVGHVVGIVINSRNGRTNVDKHFGYEAEAFHGRDRLIERPDDNRNYDRKTEFTDDVFRVYKDGNLLTTVSTSELAEFIDWCRDEMMTNSPSRDDIGDRNATIKLLEEDLFKANQIVG